jgi:cell division protein FtsB
MTSENNELKNKILLLRNDLTYMEAVARKELGMVKKGDIVYRLAK